ncbi:hypothetical protein K3495_g6223 [Podosphaera aphanis]|nr:hypothetical protein K3495_g6223 [Podosphaera aphanis]
MLPVQPVQGFLRPVSSVMNPSRNSAFPEVVPPLYDNSFYSRSSGAFSPSSIIYSPPAITGTPFVRPVSMYSPSAYAVDAPNMIHGLPGPSYKTLSSPGPIWESQGRLSPESYLEDFVPSPHASDYVLESPTKIVAGKSKCELKGQSQQRRPSNRDEFDGPHQFLQRPPPEYIAQQERDLPHLPTNLVVHEQDSILSQVNDRLSQCAFDFVAKYQFPIPLSNGEMRPVERPQDREWTEWVYLLKRLATKRRIPARVLYNGQIKQFITILENSLEMRYAAKHQSRPLKDDRNILQLISAGIQVAKILKDASAMDYLDRLYVTTEMRIQERSSSRYRP